MAKKFPILPAHPERVCWGCDLYCQAHDMACGNGAERTPHPSEVQGDDWMNWELPQDDEPQADLQSAPQN